MTHAKETFFFLADQNKIKIKKKEKEKKEYKWSGTSQLNDTTCFLNLVVRQVSMILDQSGNVRG